MYHYKNLFIFIIIIIFIFIIIIIIFSDTDGVYGLLRLAPSFGNYLTFI